MTPKRKTYSTEFKVKVTLDALRENTALAELAKRHGIHRTLIADWKRQAVAGLANVFAQKMEVAPAIAKTDDKIDRLHAKIGELVMERDSMQRSSEH